VLSGSHRSPRHWHASSRDQSSARTTGTLQQEGSASGKAKTSFGAIVRSEGDRYTVQARPDDGWGAMAFVVMLCAGLGRQRLMPIEGAPALPTRGSSMDATVDPSAVILARLHLA